MSSFHFLDHEGGNDENQPEAKNKDRTEEKNKDQPEELDGRDDEHWSEQKTEKQIENTTQ